MVKAPSCKYQHRRFWLGREGTTASIVFSLACSHVDEEAGKRFMNRLSPVGLPFIFDRHGGSREADEPASMDDLADGRASAAVRRLPL